MNINNIKARQIRTLKDLLRGACHAPGCHNLKRCPRQCQCRYEREFELNTDTAICWEIAELLVDLQRSERVNKSYVKEIKDKIIGYAEVTRHHSSKGWEAFFWSVNTTYRTIVGEIDWPDDSADGRLRDLKNKINRLKRYPKENV